MANRIPQQILDDLLARIDLVELIDRRIPLRKTGRNYSACCPFHNEKTPSFNVSPDKQFYHCFGCGASGNAISFLMDYERLAFREAVAELARQTGVSLPETIAAGPDTRYEALYPLLVEADRFFRRQLRQHPQRQRAIDYLRGRGLDGVTTRDYGIGYAPPGWGNLCLTLGKQGYSERAMETAGLVIARDQGGGVYDRFRDRIMFPIRDRRGRTIGFGGRALDDSPPKYLNSPETPVFHKSRQLYGLYELQRQRNARHTRVLIVEGYMDVLALAQHGIPYALATLGTATTSEHLQALFRLSDDLVFCFDGDRAGRDAAWRALELILPLLRDGRRVAYLFLAEGEDPDSLIRQIGRETFEQRISTATPLSDYLLEHLTARTDLASVDGRARLVELARPLLGKLPAGAYRDLLQQALEQRVQIPVELLDGHASAPTKHVTARSSSAPQTRRTLPRLAISLLLQQPSLALRVPHLEILGQLDVPGLPLFTELVECLRANPHITLGALLERYRDTETGRILTRLAQTRLDIDDQLVEAEFMGVLDKFKTLYVDRYWFDKAARGELDEDQLHYLKTHTGNSDLH